MGHCHIITYKRTLESPTSVIAIEQYKNNRIVAMYINDCTNQNVPWDTHLEKSIQR